MKTWAEVESDPAFKNGDPALQESVRSEFIKRTEANPDFAALPDKDKDAVRRRVSGEPGSSLPDTVISAAKAAGRLIGESLREQRDALARPAERAEAKAGEALAKSDDGGAIKAIADSVSQSAKIRKTHEDLDRKINEGLPQFKDFVKWSTRSELGSLADKLTDTSVSGLASMAANINRIPALVVDAAALPTNIALKMAGRDERIKSPDWLIENQNARYWDEKSKQAADLVPELSEDFLDIASKAYRSGDAEMMSHAARVLAFQVVQNAPNSATMAAAAATGAGIPSLVAMGAMSAADANRAGRAAGVDPIAGTIHAGVSGVAEAYFEQRGTFRVIEKMGNMLSKKIGKAGAKELMGAVVKTLGASFFTEAKEEMQTEAVQNISAFATGVDPKAMQGIGHKIAKAGVLGGAAGASSTFGGAIASGALKARIAEARGRADNGTASDYAYKGAINVVGKEFGGIGAKMGEEATPAAVKAAATQASEAVLANLESVPWPGYPAMDSSGAAGREAGVIPDPKPLPIDPNHIAPMVIAASADGPDVRAMAETYPWLYAASSLQGDVPPSARAKYNALETDVAERLGLPHGPVPHTVIADAIKTGNISFVDLNKMDYALFEAEVLAQGAHPDTISRLYADARTAAMRPAETMVAHHAHEQAVVAFQKARSEADAITRSEAEAVARGPETPIEPKPENIPAVEPPSQPDVPLPGRADALQEAVEAGMPLEQAAEAHRAMALDEQELGTLDPDIAAEYADAGDIDFDPVALEAQNQSFPDMAKHPSEMTPDEFKESFPDAPPELHKQFVDDAAHEAETEHRKEAKEAMRSAGITAQPAHDILRSMPIGEDWIENLGLSGEFKNLKGRGLTVKGGTSENKVDYAVSRLISAGVLPEGATINDMLDVLDAESRKGTRAEAQASMVREGGPASDPGGEPRKPLESARQNPPETPGEGLQVSPARVGKGPSNLSITDKADFDKALANRSMAGDKVAAGQPGHAEYILERMKGEVAEARAALATPGLPEKNAKWLLDSLTRHEADIAKIERGLAAPAPTQASRNSEAKDEPVKRDRSNPELNRPHYSKFDDGAQGFLFDEAGRVNPDAVAPKDDALPLSESAGERTPIIENPTDKPMVKGSVSEITDSGSELFYNRRNLVSKGLKWDDIRGMNATLKALEVTKTKVWPRPDYEDLVAGGMNPLTAHLVKQVYDSISTKPSVSGAASDAQMEAYVNEVARVKEAVFTWAKDIGAQKGILEGLMESAKARMGGISLISQMGRGTSNEAMLDALYPKNAEGQRWGRTMQAQNDLINLVGGNKLIDALRVNTESARTAVKAINKGWPAPQEAWEKRFEVREVPAGTKQWSREKGEHTTDKAHFEIKVLASRGMMVRGEFPTRDAAIARAKELAAKKPDTRRMAEAALTEFERTGPPQRPGGLDVTPKSLQDKFGFRGINYGNYTDQGERQVFTNNAYDSLLDLADIMGLPAAAISLNGTLGLAYGAQGRGGKYAAHFVPGVNEINLTKDAGAGSLAHEWWHALDHYFAVQAGESYAKGGEPYLTHIIERESSGQPSYFRAEGGALAGLRPEIRKAFLDIVESMKKVQETPEQVTARIEAYKAIAAKRLEQWLKYFRDRIEAAGTMESGKPKTLSEKDKAINANHIKQFDLLADALRRGDVGAGWEKIGTGAMSAVRTNVGELRRLYKDVTGHVPSPDDIKALDASAASLKGRLDAKYAAEDQKAQSAESQYSKDARGLDGPKKSGKEYWSRETELGARAFQSYILDRLEAQNRRNDYLTRPQGAPADYKEAGGDPYPRGAEREKINAAFDVLVKSLLTKESPTGGTMIYDSAWGGAETSKPAIPDEQSKAYGPGVDLTAVSDAVQLDLDLGGKTGVSQKLAKDGKIDYRGIEINDIQDIAEVVASRRHPKLEHNNFVLVRKGKVVAHMVYTSGLPNAVLISPADFAELAREVKELGADEVWTGHNHPTGNPNPSEADRGMSSKLRDIYGEKYKGMIVTDGEEFAHISHEEDRPGFPETRPGAEFIKFKTPKEKFPSTEGPEIRTNTDAVAAATRDANIGKSPVYLFLDSHNKVMSFESDSALEGAPAFTRRRIKELSAAGVIVVAPEKEMLTPESMPREMADVIYVDAGGRITQSSAQIGSGFPVSGKGESVYGPLSSWRVAEEPPRYMGGYGMDKDDFARAIAKSKIVPGSPITARVSGRGFKRGDKGAVVSVDRKDIRILVKFGDNVAVVRPEDLVETRRKPAARAAVEQAKKDARKSGKPSQPVKRTITEGQEGLANPAPTIGEMEGLRATLSAEARGAKNADALVRKEMRARLREQMREKHAALRAAQKEIRHAVKEAHVASKWDAAARNKVAEFARAFLPPSERGALLSRIVDAKTDNDLLEAFVYIDRRANMYANKESMGTIRLLVERVRRSKTFPVGVKLQIEELISDIRLENWSEKTIDMLAAQESLIAAARLSGENVEVPKALLETIGKLTKRPLAELDSVELADIIADLRMLVERGKEVRAVALDLKEQDREEALADLVAGTKKVLESPTAKEGITRAVGKSKSLTWAQKMKNKWLGTADSLQTVGTWLAPVQAIMDDLDGRYLGGGPNRREWERLQGAFIDAAAYVNRKEDQFAKAIREIGPIDELERERILIVLYAEQNDIRPHLHKWGLADQDIDVILRTQSSRPKEQSYIRAARELFSNPEDIAKLVMVAARLNNDAFVQEQNYFPIKTKFKIANPGTSASEILNHEINMRKKSPNRGSLIARQAGAARELRTDFEKIVADAIREQANLIYMAEPLLRAHSIFTDPAYEAAAGDAAVEFWKDYIDTLARQGVFAMDGLERSVTNVIRNMGAGALTFKPHIALMQFSSLGPGAAIVGGGNIKRAIFSGDSWKGFVSENMPLVQGRGGGDPDLKDAIHGGPDALAKWNELGFKNMVDADLWTAQQVALGAYFQFMDKAGLVADPKNPHPPALRYAQSVTGRAMASPWLIDKPLVQSRGKVLARGATQFQGESFAKFALYKDMFKHAGESAGPGAADMVYVAAAYAYEGGIRWAWRGSVMAMLFSLGVIDRKQYEKFKKKDTAYWKQVLSSMANTIPFVGSVANSIMYDSGPIPTFDVTVDFVKSIGGMVTGAIDGKPIKTTRAVVGALTSLGMLSGIGGSSQLGYLAKSVLRGKNDKRKKRGYIH